MDKVITGTFKKILSDKLTSTQAREFIYDVCNPCGIEITEISVRRVTADRVDIK